MKTNIIHTGDCFDVLAHLPKNSVNCVMTSPPYWNLRDYDHQDQLGLEENSDGYVQNLADVFDEVYRVLRSDGSLWLNLGDTYEDKNLQQIPARVALELQKRGWTLRNRVTWAKPNPMPQSVKDRLNDTTEAVFHFVKNKEYWYDLDSIRESHCKEVRNAIEDIGEEQREKSLGDIGTAPERNDSIGEYVGDNNAASHPAGKNPGDVFNVTTKPFPEAHFAVYPPELCEKPIKATCPEGGVMLDPFAGAGTTCLKAKELGRKFIGIELNPEYADMARARVGLTPNDPSVVRGDDSQQGFEQF